LGDLGADGRIILKEMLEEQGVRVWTGFIWHSIRTNEHNNEFSCSTNDGNIFVSLVD
jgi:hypothetical protein